MTNRRNKGGRPRLYRLTSGEKTAIREYRMMKQRMAEIRKTMTQRFSQRFFYRAVAGKSEEKE